MGKYGRCLSMPSTSSSWTTLLESLPGEAWPLHLGAPPPEQGQRGHPLGDLVGESIGSRLRRGALREMNSARGRPEERSRESSHTGEANPIYPPPHSSAYFLLPG